MSASFGNMAVKPFSQGFSRVPRSTPHLQSADPLLGEWRFSKEVRAWTATTNVGGQRLDFVIGGESKPDEALVTHAHDIIRDFALFDKAIRTFLATESASYPDLVDEITRLRVACITLPLPDSPNDGEIGFSGPDGDRVWHCHYADREPSRLGFDD